MKMVRRIIGWLLHNANAEASRVAWGPSFYKIKDRVLLRFGESPGAQRRLFSDSLVPVIHYQHWPEKECWHCWSDRYCSSCEFMLHCCRCLGSGIYSPEYWVKLKCVRVGRYDFHQPIGRTFVAPPHVEFEGRIRHSFKPYGLSFECYLWLVLLFAPSEWRWALRSVRYLETYRWRRPLTAVASICSYASRCWERFFETNQVPF